MANGFSEKVAGIITVKLAEYQAAQWEREREERRLQLEEQKEANRAYGEKRDAERAIQQAAADRKSRMHIALVAPLASIATAVIMWLLTRL